MKNEYLIYDTTSISSYSETMEQIKYGHNKDLESLPQLNLAMVFGEDSMLPVYFRKLPGNISDVSTVKKLLIDISFLGLEKVNFVLDRGFCSADNLNSLYRNRHKFVISGRSNAALVQSSIKEMQGTGQIPQLYFQKEKAFLNPLPREEIRKPYQIGTRYVKVNTACMFSYQNAQYSVPPEYKGKQLRIQVYDQYLHVYSNTQLITMHSPKKQ